MTLVYAPAHLAIAATPLVVAALCYREWVAMGRPGTGSPWAAAIAVCVAVIAVGSGAALVLGASSWVVQLIGVRGGGPAVAAGKH